MIVTGKPSSPAKEVDWERLRNQFIEVLEAWQETGKHHISDFEFVSMSYELLAKTRRVMEGK